MFQQNHIFQANELCMNLQLDEAICLLVTSCFKDISSLTVDAFVVDGSCVKFVNCVIIFAMYCKKLRKIRIENSTKLAMDFETKFFAHSMIQFYAKLIRFDLV